MPMPSFLIIGAQKSGTTALYHMLQQHPQIFMSAVKEPHYFAFEEDRRPHFNGPGDNDVVDHQFVLNKKGYMSLFDHAPSGGAAGEASAMYIYFPQVATRISHELPDARILACLRNPVDRAYSSYQHLVRDEREKENSFAAALAAEEQRVADGWIPLWHYFRAGLYHEQLLRYYDAFAAPQIKIVIYDDLDRQPARVVREVFTFLGVDPDFQPDVSTRYNVSGVHTSRATAALYRYLLHPPQWLLRGVRPVVPVGMRREVMDFMTDAMRRTFLKPAPSVDQAVRESLNDRYRDDVANLSDLLGRDLSHWLTS